MKKYCGCCGSDEKVKKTNVLDKWKRPFKEIKICKVCYDDTRGGTF